MTAMETEQLVTPDQMTQITCDVWASFLSLELAPTSDEPAAELAGDTMTGCVHISGDWQGSVIVEVSAAHAQRAAEAMFAADEGSLSPEEIGDALGELTNMVGGNLKGLLPAPSKLSLPSVASGQSYSVRVPGARLVDRVLLEGTAGPVRVSLWRS